MTLGVTDTLKPTIDFYLEWIKSVVPDVGITLLSYERDNLDEVRCCDGLLLTGGGDIHPKHYGHEDARGMVHGVDEQRDTFEFEVVRKAARDKLPTLGICRGMQVFNVALGGTMIPDLLSEGYGDHRKPEGAAVDPVHQIDVQKDSLLFSITGTWAGEVNTHHHQGVSRCADRLRVGAYSPDGVIESLEWNDNRTNPFVLLLQWHPERMINAESPF
jgi:putative glutamine amidotransferase